MQREGGRKRDIEEEWEGEKRERGREIEREEESETRMSSIVYLYTEVLGKGVVLRDGGLGGVRIILLAFPSVDW